VQPATAPESNYDRAPLPERAPNGQSREAKKRVPVCSPPKRVIGSNTNEAVAIGLHTHRGTTPIQTARRLIGRQRNDNPKRIAFARRCAGAIKA
jgi:hypothetical protein